MIIIAGASWAVGEYNKDCELSGPGFSQYISLHDRVVNLSAGGLTNRQSLERLADFLDRYRIDNSQDSIYWVVNCPLNDIDSRSIGHISSLGEAAKSILGNDFLFANDLANNSNIDIKLIGGLCDLDRLDCVVPDRLKIIVPSWGRLIDPDYPSDWLTPDSGSWTDLGQNLKTNRPDLIEEWLSITQNTDRKMKCWKKLEGVGFNTYHPDRHGHKILRDFIFPEWKHKV